MSLILGPESGKDLERKEIPLPVYLLAMRSKQLKCFFISLAISYKWNGKIVQFLETLHPGQKRFQFERHNIGN